MRQHFMLLLVCLVCVACSPSPTIPPTDLSTRVVTPIAPATLFPTRAPTSDATAPPTRVLTIAPSSPSGDTPTPNVVISPRQPVQVVNVSIGHVIAFTRPLDAAEWQVDYDSTLLSPLTPAEKMRKPDAQGWLFRALATGQSDLIFTSIVACAQPPCPPTVARFVVTVNVQK